MSQWSVLIDSICGKNISPSNPNAAINKLWEAISQFIPQNYKYNSKNGYSNFYPNGFWRTRNKCSTE